MQLTITGKRIARVLGSLFIFLWGSTAWAQTGTLSGKVFEADTSAPMPYANVIVEGKTKGTYTASDGSYAIKLDTGWVKIRYRFISFRDTVIQFHIQQGKEVKKNVYLKPDRMSLDVTVSANRVARKVRELARLRNQQNSNLKNYKADVYKLAILSHVDKKFSYENINTIELEPIAFAERKSEVTYLSDPERYSETLVANRASTNFFSEFDFFSTGGTPLNLNSDEVNLSILSEGLTVVGPVSKEAAKYYDFYDEEADSSWPKGTMEIYFEPKKNNHPLFEGRIWYHEDQSVILGIDVTLNDYADTNTGTFKVTDLRYQQSYERQGDFWLPDKTELSAMIEFITSEKPIYYHDVWTWSDFGINESGLEPEEVELSTLTILADAHTKKTVFWDTLSNKQGNENVALLGKAQNYEEDRAGVRAGMTAMKSFFRLPYQLERFYLTNFSDIYHYNRVQGHYLGLGLRTPVNDDYEYRLVGGYGFGNHSYHYLVSGYHFIAGSFVAPEARYFKETVAQYQDYEYNRTPLDFFNARQTIQALATGTSGNNFFERQGVEAGLRFRFDTESFLRVLYRGEDYHSLQATTRICLITSCPTPEEFVNNDPIFPAEEGRSAGLLVQLHHDTRQYLRTQFLRDYNIREFGWLADVVLEKGIGKWGSDFDYNRYRLGLKFYWPVFSSHFFQTDIIMGAADTGVPNQRLFTYNGYVVDDYVRYRPFNTVDYREPLGSRISEIRIRYKFGSSLTRSIPIEFIQKSGIQISTLFTVGVICNGLG